MILNGILSVGFLTNYWVFHIALSFLSYAALTIIMISFSKKFYTFYLSYTLFRNTLVQERRENVARLTPPYSSAWLLSENHEL